MKPFKRNEAESAAGHYVDRLRLFLFNGYDFTCRLFKLPFSAIIVFFVVVAFLASLVGSLTLIIIDYSNLADMPRLAEGSRYVMFASLYALLAVMAFKPLHLMDTVPKLMNKDFVSDYNLSEIKRLTSSLGLVMLALCVLIAVVPLLLWEM